MSIEHAFGLRNAIRETMNDPEIISIMASFGEYCSQQGAELDMDMAKSIYSFAWTMAAAGASSTAYHFLGEEGMDALNDTLDELVRIEDSMEGMLDAPPDEE